MFDYIIVGSGPAGCVLANRLTADPKVRVLLLEAGKPDRHPLIHLPAGFAKMTGTLASWGYSTEPQKHLNNRQMWYPQGKVLGGGSSINAQVFTRGNPNDYNQWASEDGCEGWSHEDILPYYRRSEDNPRFSNKWHGVGGPLRVSDPEPQTMTQVFVRACQEAGFPYNPDFNGASQEGFGFYQTTTHNGRRSSAPVSYLRPVMSRSNLTIKTNSLVRRVVIEEGRAVGVALKQGAGETVLRCQREVLVTAGAIGSPKLLLLSGIGPAEELRRLGIPVVADVPGVGKNLHDHVDIFQVSECSDSYSFDRYKPPHMALWAGLQYLLFRTGPVASNLVDGGGFWWADDKAPSPDIQFHFLPGSGLEHGVKKIKNGVTLNSTIMQPRSRGSVTLKSPNPDEAPNIDPNFWSDPYDQEVSIKGFKIARKIMAQPSFKPYIKSEVAPGPDVQSDDEIADYGRQNCKTDYHPAGTCRMGPATDRRTVVAPDLKVRGVAGLRVIDSSVMPRVVSSNTYSPVVMIAEKGADLVHGITRERTASKE